MGEWGAGGGDTRTTVIKLLLSIYPGPRGHAERTQPPGRFCTPSHLLKQASISCKPYETVTLVRFCISTTSSTYVSTYGKRSCSGNGDPEENEKAEREGEETVLEDWGGRAERRPSVFEIARSLARALLVRTKVVTIAAPMKHIVLVRAPHAHARGGRDLLLPRLFRKEIQGPLVNLKFIAVATWLPSWSFCLFSWGIVASVSFAGAETFFVPFSTPPAVVCIPQTKGGPLSSSKQISFFFLSSTILEQPR